MASNGSSACSSSSSSDPVCLISGNHEGLRVTDEGIALLESIREPIAVICLAGQYRTGKSFFLNQLTRTKQCVEQVARASGSAGDDGDAANMAALATNGFRVGPTTESCTRGIWLWAPTPSIRSACGAKVLFMDTEGIAATDNDESYDAKIFSLGLLLSSLFVLNTMGVIDEGAIDRLFLVAELTKHVCVSTTGGDRSTTAAQSDSTLDESESESELPDALAETRELAPHFPPFVWLLRDFTLEMAADGAALTPNAYLERALEPRDSSNSSRRADERNRIRAALRLLFATRECLTLVRPVTDEQQLRRAATLSTAELRPEFVAQMARIRDRLLAIAAPKQLCGRVMDGAQLAHLAQCYTATMNNGAVPDIRAAWSYVSDATNARALAAATALYDERIGTTAVESSDPSGVPTIMTQQAFEAVAKDAQDAALAMYKHASVDGASRTTCFQTLKVHIQRQKTTHVAMLQQRSTECCDRVLSSLRASLLTQPLAAGQWNLAQLIAADTTDSSNTLAATLETLETQYDAHALGPSKRLAFHNFLRRDVVAHADALVKRLAEAHTAAQREFERDAIAQQHAYETQAREAAQQLQTSRNDVARLTDAKAHSDERAAMLSARVAELQQQLEQQQCAAQALDATVSSLRADCDALAAAANDREKDIARLEAALEHARATLRDHDDAAQSAKLELTETLAALRRDHEAATTEWITKLADQTADRNGVQRQLTQRTHELQQVQHELELQTKRLEAVRDELTHAQTATARADTEAQRLTALVHTLESQLDAARTSEVQRLELADRDRAALQRRIERYETQLGRIEAASDVRDVLRDCVAEVARLADVDRLRVVDEEKALLQTQLANLYLKVSTLPDFYQREIFCSPEPTPDFFDALTS